MFQQDMIIQIRYRRSKIQSFKQMCLKPELITLIQSLKTPNPNFLEVTEFVLHVIYNRPSNEKTPGDSRYAILFVKKGKNKRFNDTKSLPPDQHSLNMKILCASFIGYSISSCMQPVYETLNRLDYGWQLIDGVHVPVWSSSLQLSTQEEISHHQETN